MQAEPSQSSRDHLIPLGSPPSLNVHLRTSTPTSHAKCLSPYVVVHKGIICSNAHQKHQRGNIQKWKEVYFDLFAAFLFVIVFIVVFHVLVMHITNQFNKTRYGNNLLRKVFLHIQRDATCRLGSSPGLLIQSNLVLTTRLKT